MTDPSRALALLEQVLTLDVAARSAFIEAECGGDRALREELEALLAADARPDHFFEPLGSPPRDHSGERVGPWRLLRELGHGGMGSVYLAERADGLYATQVAVKLLRVDLGDLRERFANERRILATLDHPNIARLLDAGADVGGAPYVAMEYVEGEPITRWCDAHRTDLVGRLHLFLKVLDAVQSAHGRLVVHRDIKPANILVDAHGEPKLLDFGIAKLIDNETRGLTLTGIAPLTPEYASPEQVRGEPVGTSSDIYALGVLLFELTTGARPYVIASTAPAIVERTVCHAQPPRPSVAAQAHGRGRIDRDLDHVILKALSKASTDRYASCAQFADDLRRFLDGRPVLATHASWRYRARKFVRRHRWPVALTALIAMALAASTVVAIYQAKTAREQARIARSERDKAERTNAFLQEVIAAPDPSRQGRTITVAELLDGAAASLDAGLKDEPNLIASLRLTLATSYRGLGLFDQALQQARAAVALIDADPEADAATRARAAVTLGEVLHDRSEDDEARSWLQRASAFDAPGAATWVGEAEEELGVVTRHAGDNVGAEQHYRRALAVYRTRTDPEDSHIAVVLNDLAIIRGEEGDLKAAIALHEEALAIMRRLHPSAHPETATVLVALADVRADAGDFAGADAGFSEALAMQLALLGENHRDTIFTLTGYAFLRERQKRYVEAEALARRAWNAARAHLPDPHQETAYAGIILSEALVDQNRAGEAVPILRDTLAMRRKLVPADHPLLANTESVLGSALAKSGNVVEGEPLMRGAVDRLTRTLGPDHEMTRGAAARLAAFDVTQVPRP
jgi:tetratricopeptide (TPR) repeat protein